MKVLLVINPISGSRNKEQFIKKAETLCEKLNYDLFILKTTGKNDEETIQQQLKEIQPNKVFAVGGDGTVLLVATQLINSEHQLGIIPMGSANGMATELDIDTNPIDALEHQLRSKNTKPLDLIKVNENHYCMHIGDVGLNAQLVKQFSEEESRGMFSYAKHLLNVYLESQPFPVTIKADGASYSCKTYMLGICNSRKYGTGIPLNAISQVGDGLFELITIDEVDTVSILKTGISSISKAFSKLHSGKIIQTDSAEVYFESPQLLQLDGEVIGEVDQLKIEIMKKAVALID